MTKEAILNMEKNKKIIIIVAALLVIAGVVYYTTANTPEESKEEPVKEVAEEVSEEPTEEVEETTEEQKEEPFYNESLVGIPHLEGQNLVQETGSILSYKIENIDMTVEEVTDHFIENTDNELWEVEKLESNDENSQQLIYNSKDEKNLTITQVGIIKSGENMLISLTSHD